MAKTHVVILNRWGDEFADYTRYIDHHEFRVSYVTTRATAPIMPQGIAAGVLLVDDFDVHADLASACRVAERRAGPISHLVALSEFDLERAAALREAFNIPGAQPADVKPWRDKVEMKCRVAQAGLPVPAFEHHANRETVKTLAARCGFPLVLKPRQGAASAGVVIVRSLTEAEGILDRLEHNDYECEEYVDGPILHVDGLVWQGDVVFLRISWYINTCLDFAQGRPLGSVVSDDPWLNRRIHAFTAQVLRALNVQRSAFHLEFIMLGSEFVFLEIGARVGGGEIPFVMKEVYGVDLIGSWVQMELGAWKGLSVGDHEGVVAGFLMLPEPRTVPCRVVRCTSLRGSVPYLYQEIIPAPGTVLDGKGGYEHISGRFRFRGPTSRAVTSAVRLGIERFRIDVETQAESRLAVASSAPDRGSYRLGNDAI